MLDFADIRRTAAAVIGAALFSATCVIGAVGPAKAAVPAVATETPSKPVVASSNATVQPARPILM